MRSCAVTRHLLPDLVTGCTVFPQWPGTTADKGPFIQCNQLGYPTLLWPVLEFIERVIGRIRPAFARIARSVRLHCISLNLQVFF
jgi:hypothetical protein